MVVALQGAATSLVDVSIGSVVRAIFEANAGLVLWLQWLVLQVLSMTRASTSTGADLDSWMNDFGLARLPAIAATGTITLSRFSTNLTAFVPVGTIVKTGDGNVTFSVTADATNSTWQADSLGYTIPVGVASVDVPVVCQSSGSIGNVMANTVTLIASSLSGVDQVTNSVAFANGIDTEDDAGFRVRFRNYLAGLSKATAPAIAAVISSFRQGLAYKIKENTLPDGEQRAGSFLVIIDDGTGYPNQDLLSSLSDAIEAVRPIGVTFNVVPPTVQLVNVTVTIQMEVGSATPTQSAIAGAIENYISLIPLEGMASITRIAQSLYANIPGVSNVSNISLNGGSVDIVASAGAVLRPGQITAQINVG